MTDLTVTEALAEIKTIGKRVEKKREFINAYLARQDGIRDPLERAGGSAKNIAEDRQAIADLEERVIYLRRAIQRANDATTITINGKSRTVSEWLTWRREIAGQQRHWLSQVLNSLRAIREKAKSQGAAMFAATATVNSEDVKPTDFIVNIDELEISKTLEQLEDTLGQLDGQLSLKNATVLI